MYCLSQSSYLWHPRQDSCFEWQFFRRWASIATTVTHWQSSQRAHGPDLCGLVLLGRDVTNEKSLYGTIKYDRMGWDCSGTLWTNCTGKWHIFCSLCECSKQQARDLLVTPRRRNLGGGLTPVVLEMDACATLEHGAAIF